ncbi:MAG TPA: AMP-binding protein, partial [Acidimicrobiales bacterium]|nr:AMP-binding protein [Acidimicrobiales bacterium]
MIAAPTGTDGTDGTDDPGATDRPGRQPSIADLLMARADDDHVGLRFEDQRWSWRQVVAASAARADLLTALPRSGEEDDRPWHVGVLLGNIPEYLFWLGAAALTGSVVVGINPTRRGQALAGDIRRTDCWLVVTDAAGAALLDGLDIGVGADRVLRVDRPDYEARLGPHRSADPRSIVSSARPTAEDLFLLLFTSGTTGAPKAVRCTQGRLTSIAQVSAAAYGFDRSDVAYCTMPLFHGNALMVLWGPALAVGATVALARRFTASGFVADVRRYGATTFTYVGKALAYILATPPADDDATVTLVRGFGTEASV